MKNALFAIFILIVLPLDSQSQDHHFSASVGKISILSPSHYDATYLDGYTFETSYMLQTSKFNQLGMIASVSSHQGSYPNPTLQSMQLKSFGLLNKFFMPAEMIPTFFDRLSMSPYILTELGAIHRDQKNVVIINSGPTYSKLLIESTNTKIAYSVGSDFSLENNVKVFAEYGRAIYYFQEGNRIHNKLMLGLRFTLDDLVR